MFIISQNKKFSLNTTSISRFHLDENHSVFAYCADSDESLLLGEYKTADKALDAMVEVTTAIWEGRNYQMPDDN